MVQTTFRRKTMRTLLKAGVIGFLVVVFAGSIQATPLSASGALATAVRYSNLYLTAE